MYYDEAVYRAKVTVSKDGQVTVRRALFLMMDTKVMMKIH